MHSVCLSLIATLVTAAGPDLVEGRSLYHSLRYRLAEEHLRRALSGSGNTPDERFEAHDLLARSLAAQGRLEEAEVVYRELLQEDPHAPTPVDASPKIAGAFDRAKRRLFPPRRATLRLTADGDVLRVALVDPWEVVAALKLRELQPSGASLDLELTQHQAHVARASVPKGEYVIEALDADGEVLARLGSEARPLALGPALELETPSKTVQALPVISEAPPALAAAPARPRWVAWGLLGLAGAAVATGTALAVSSAHDAQAARDTARALDTAAFNDSAHQKAVAANFLIGGAVVGGAAGTFLLWRWR
ncbi:MAG: tetratricopeptide repeat protein [Myxococcaceae bacterium]